MIIAWNGCIFVCVGWYKESWTTWIEAGGPVSVVLWISRTKGVALAEGASGIVVEEHGAIVDGIDLKKATSLRVNELE